MKVLERKLLGALFVLVSEDGKYRGTQKHLRRKAEIDRVDEYKEARRGLMKMGLISLEKPRAEVSGFTIVLLPNVNNVKSGILSRDIKDERYLSYLSNIHSFLRKEESPASLLPLSGKQGPFGATFPENQSSLSGNGLSEIKYDAKRTMAPHVAYPLLTRCCRELGLVPIRPGSPYGQRVLKKMYQQVREGAEVEDFIAVCKKASELSSNSTRKTTYMRNLMRVFGDEFNSLLSMSKEIAVPVQQRNGPLRTVTTEEAAEWDTRGHGQQVDSFISEGKRELNGTRKGNWVGR